MTAVPARRTRVTLVGFIVGVAGVGAVGGLGYAGVENLYDSRAGSVVAPDQRTVPTSRLPFTYTALVGTTDEDGWLTSVAVLALEPDGTGGSIVSLSASGDVSSGNAEQLAPLNAVYVVDGPEQLLAAGEGLTGLSFDVAEVVDAERFAELAMPLGELVVELPTELRDASTGERYAAGVVRMTPADAGEAIVARDPAVDDWLFDQARAAVWAGMADGVGSGVGSSAFPEGAEVTQPATLDEFVDRLFAGPVEHRSLSSKEISATRVREQLEDSYRAAFTEHDGTTVTLVAHDRAEVSMVLGAIAPGRLGSPYEGPTVRIVARFGADELEPLGLNNADVARQAINRLLFAQVNIVSFGQTDAPPDLTVFEVANPAQIDAVKETFGTLLGESDVRAAEAVIEGVDVQITLGRAYLETVEPAG